MSTIRQTPYIEELLASMSEQNLNDLKTILDSGGNNVNLDFEHLIADTYKNKVTPVYFKFEDNGLKTGILIWTDTKCALICYHRFQDLIIFELDPTYHTYEKIKQYCDINELRRVLDDTIEKTGAIDSGDADKGQIPVADGEGGVEWKDNFQELVLTNQSGTLTDNEIALAKEGNTVARLGSDGQFYYKDAQNNYYVIFKAAARVANDDTIVEKITIDLSDNTYSYSYDVVAAGESFTPTYDDELSDASTNAVQNKVVTKALNDAVADIESGRTIVGKAKTAQALDNVSENSGSTQEDPFIAQGTGTNNNTSETPTSPKAHQLEKQGNTVVVNQLRNNYVSTKEVNGITITNNNNGTITISGTSTDTIDTNLASIGNLIGGHKYLCLTDLSGMSGNLSNGYQIYGYGANVGAAIFNKVHTANNSGDMMIYLKCQSGVTINKTCYFICSDLTLWFSQNSLIPSYLLDHPETFINYYNGSLAYNTGTLGNSDGQYLVTVGFNQWDEETIVGTYNGTNGVYDNTQTDRLCSKNKTRCLPNERYYFKTATGLSAGNVYFYDINENFIGVINNVGNNTFDTPSNATYFNLSFGAAYGTTYKHDICINLSWDGERDGEYKPFVKHVYDTGTETLKSYDKKSADGTITRGGIDLDLSTLTWVYESQNKQFYSNVITGLSNTYRTENVICDKYVIVDADGTGMPQPHCRGIIDGRLYIIDESLGGDGTLITGNARVKAETPTTEQGTPFDEIIDVDDYGTMQWLDTDSEFVEVPQGCKLFYPADYALLIDDLGNYTDYDVTKLAKKSELDTTFETYLKGLTGYDATKTQKLQNVEGTLTWVDEE